MADHSGDHQEAGYGGQMGQGNREDHVDQQVEGQPPQQPGTGIERDPGESVSASYQADVRNSPPQNALEHRAKSTRIENHKSQRDEEQQQVICGISMRTAGADGQRQVNQQP